MKTNDVLPVHSKRGIQGAEPMSDELTYEQRLARLAADEAERAAAAPIKSKRYEITSPADLTRLINQLQPACIVLGEGGCVTHATHHIGSNFLELESDE
jgi:hypothetical protein